MGNRYCSNKERILWIDSLRAIAMLMVLVEHTVLRTVPGWEKYKVITGPLMIPLFFFVIGYVSDYVDWPIRRFWKHIVRKLVIPWIFLSLIWVWLIVAIFFKGASPYFTCKFYALVRGDIFWFIPACILAEIIWFHTCRIKSCRLRCLTSAILFAVGIVMAKNDIGYFGRINNALVAQIYICLGYVFLVCRDRIKKYVSSLAIIGCGLVYCLLVAVIVKCLPGEYMDVHLNMYYDMPVFSLAMITIGSYVLMMIFMKYDFKCNLLEFVGRNTLVFYMLHGRAYALLVKAYKYFEFGAYPATWSGAIFKVVFACVCCSVASVVLNRYVPFLVGKK